MPSSKDKTRIKDLYNLFRAMAKTNESMGKAFQGAIIALQRRIDEQGKLINLLFNEHPEILNKLPIQSEEAGTDAVGGRTTEPRILSLPSTRANRGDTGADDSAKSE